MEKLEKAYLDKSISYDQFLNLVHELVRHEKTSGPNQSPERIEYTKLNEYRLLRLGKTIHINESLTHTVQSVQKKWIWIILVEAWCGDVAQNVPILERIAQLNPFISTHYLFRDENLPLMDQYLTNGGRSIPKLICYDAETLLPIGHWGPRPHAAQQLMMHLKAQEPPLSFEEIHQPLHKWYVDDKAHALQNEMEVLIKSWMG